MVVWSGLQLNGDSPHRLGTPHSKPKLAVETITKITEYTGNRHMWISVYPTPRIQDNQPNNVTYKMYKYPTMNKTGSRPSSINMKFQIDTIATITTPDFISVGLIED